MCKLGGREGKRGRKVTNCVGTPSMWYLYPTAQLQEGRIEIGSDLE